MSGQSASLEYCALAVPVLDFRMRHHTTPHTKEHQMSVIGTSGKNGHRLFVSGLTVRTMELAIVMLDMFQGSAS